MNNHSNKSNDPDDLNFRSLTIDNTLVEQNIQQDAYPAALKSPRSSSTYTSTINADIHAKLLAFQEQRQSKPGSSNSSPLQETNFENLGDEANRYQQPISSEQSQFQYQQQQQQQQQLSLEQQPRSLSIPQQPRSLSLSQHPQPLHQQKPELLQQHNQQQVNSTLEVQKQPTAQELLQNINLQRQKSLNAKKNKPLPPLPPVQTTEKTVNKERLDFDFVRPPPVNNSNNASASPTKPLTPTLANNDRLNPTRPAPSLPINSQVSPQIAARLPKQKQSLSQRRGMKFPGGLPTLNQPSKSTAFSSTTSSSNNNDERNNEDAPAKNVSVSSFIDRKGKVSVQQSSQLKGLFANYSEYIDIKSGSLNFQDKLSLDSNGVNFQSGQHFSISAKDLEFIEELGRGNYGTVTKVLHRPSNVIMAMKEVRLELDDSKFRQILMELQVLHNCESPYIIDFFGAFFVEGAVYMCIEYMDAGSLDKIYGSGIDEPHLAYITKSVVLGLKELKEKHNIIHRDVKPTNILVNSNGKVKLCDFGVSGNLVASLAKTNIGCQSYMAPERIKSLKPDDVRYSVQSDIWSLGLSILEAAKGCYPYPPETYDNIFSQLSAIVEGSPPELPDNYSVEARDFVKRCLDKIPDRRPNYSQLLEHPWLKKYANQDVHMDKYVQDRLQQASFARDEENTKNFEELNKKLKTPALHRGGAPTE